MSLDLPDEVRDPQSVEYYDDMTERTRALKRKLDADTELAESYINASRAKAALRMTDQPGDDDLAKPTSSLVADESARHDPQKRSRSTAPSAPGSPRAQRRFRITERVDPGGPISSTLMGWTAQRHTRTLTAVAARTRAEGDLFDAQSETMESYVKRQRVLTRVQELPEIIGTDRARRRAERAEELREVYHRHEVAEAHRLAEVAHVERELLDAQQALKAQRDYGYSNYELEWKKRNCEILDVELSAAERRAILREHLAELDQSELTERKALAPIPAMPH